MSFVLAFRSELRRIRRTPIDLALLTVVPGALLLLMGAMISPGAFDRQGVIIVDRDGGPVARKMIRNVEISPRIRVIAVTPQVGEALSSIRREDAVAALVIPKGVGDLRPGRQPVKIYYEAQFLAAGSFASNTLQSAAREAFAWSAESGAPGFAELRRELPGVHVTLLGNPTLSVEWYLGLLLGPGILHLVVALTAIGSVAGLMEGRCFTALPSRRLSIAGSLSGRLAPHALAGTLWGTIWFLWLTLAQGYWFEGSLYRVCFGLFLLFLATVAIGTLLLVLTRELASSLSGAVILMGSALAYSGASFPVGGAPAAVRVWSGALPLTHYLHLQMDEVVGAGIGPVAAEACVLMLYPIAAGGLAVWLMSRSARKAA